MLGRLKKLFLATGDILLLYLSLWLTLIIRYREFPTEHTWDQHFMPFTLLFSVWIIVFYINSLYDISTSRNDIGFYNKILHNLTINYAIAAAYFYLLTDKLFDIKPQTVFLIFILVSAVLISIWRYWYNGFVQHERFLKNVLVVGINDEAKELIEEIIKKPQLGYRIAAIIHDGYKDKNSFQNVEFYSSSHNIKDVIKEKNITAVVTVMDPRTEPKLVKQLYETLHLKVQFSDLPTFYERLTGKIPVTNIGHIWFLENLVESEKRIYEIFKRSYDILLSAILLVISLPFVPLIALLINIDSKGPVFFRQERVGILGKTFMAVKFRSMIEGAEADGQPQWAKVNDPRVTRVGRTLRKLRIDEIPQLLNVIRGEMSLIGPRPERPDFVRQLVEIIPFYNERHLIKPGMTGWAQINFGYGASSRDALKKMQYDLFYIKNRSVALDVGIALKTINLILSRKGQ